MTKPITVAKVEARRFALLDEVAAGRKGEMTRHGNVVARMVPAGGQKHWRGVLEGLAECAATDEELFSTGAWTERQPE